MLSKFIESLQKIFSAPTEQERLDDFITRQEPTSVGDVEYWINVYDRAQFNQRSANIGYHYR